MESDGKFGGCERVQLTIRSRFAQGYLARPAHMAGKFGGCERVQLTIRNRFAQGYLARPAHMVGKFGGWGGRRRRAPELEQFLKKLLLTSLKI